MPGYHYASVITSVTHVAGVLFAASPRRNVNLPGRFYLVLT